MRNNHVFLEAGGAWVFAGGEDQGPKTTVPCITLDILGTAACFINGLINMQMKSIKGTIFLLGNIACTFTQLN